MEKLEHSIRWWLKINGTWDVTHHKQKTLWTHLFDVDKDFKNFKTFEKMIEYANKLKKKIKRYKGNVCDFGFEMFGFQTAMGSWSNRPNNDIQKELMKKYLLPLK